MPLKDDGKQTIFGLIKNHLDDTFDNNLEEEEEEFEKKLMPKPIGADFYNEILTGISEDIGGAVFFYLSGDFFRTF